MQQQEIKVSFTWIDMGERKLKTAEGIIIDLSLVGSSRVKLTTEYKNRKAGQVISIKGKLLKFID